MHKNILFEYPLIEEYQDFLSKEEGQEIIELSRTFLVDGTVIGADGDPVIDYKHRNASTVPLTSFSDRLVEINKGIADRIGTILGIDKDRFEGMAVINYTENQEFKVHQDYFIGTNNSVADNNRCSQGGNRLSTAVIYLNDVEGSGETYFPWLDIKMQPKAGTMLHFKYDYDDWEANIRTQHAGMPVKSGEKWIIAVWVREEPLYTAVTDYKKFELERTIYSRLVDTEYELVVGPDDDRAQLKILLPANNDPMNAIVVGFTGGMDSCLLLYLLGICNNMQVIPYKIHPVCITSSLCMDERKIAEDWENTKLMAEIITDLVGGNIGQLQFMSAPPESKRARQVDDGLMRYFSPDNAFDYHRFNKFVYIYTGTNAAPKDIDLGYIRPTRLRVPEPWVIPFLKLQKYHIVDALLQLGLEIILEKTSKCHTNHQSLSEQCITFPCNERRWAFTKINKEELGSKYFLNKGRKND